MQLMMCALVAMACMATVLGLSSCVAESPSAQMTHNTPPPPSSELTVPVQLDQLSEKMYRRYIEPLPRLGDLPFQAVSRPGAMGILGHESPHEFSPDSVWEFAYDDTPVDGMSERAQLILNHDGQLLSLNYERWSNQNGGVIMALESAPLPVRTWPFPQIDLQLPLSEADIAALNHMLTRSKQDSWASWLPPLGADTLAWQLGAISVLRHWDTTTMPVYRIICHRTPAPGLLQVDMDAQGHIRHINYAAEYSMNHLPLVDRTIWGWLYRYNPK